MTMTVSNHTTQVPTLYERVTTFMKNTSVYQVAKRALDWLKDSFLKLIGRPSRNPRISNESFVVVSRNSQTPVVASQTPQETPATGVNSQEKINAATTLLACIKRTSVRVPKQTEVTNNRLGVATCALGSVLVGAILYKKNPKAFSQMAMDGRDLLRLITEGTSELLEQANTALSLGASGVTKFLTTQFSKV